MIEQFTPVTYESKISLGDYAGRFLPMAIRGRFRSLDGSCVATWLRSIGYDVADNYGTGRYGLAITRCGMNVSTNGYVSRVQ